MGEGLTTSVAVLQEAGTLESCIDAEFAETLVRCAGAVLAGVKPAELFSFTAHAWGHEVPPARLAALGRKAAYAYAHGLGEGAVQLEVLAALDGHVMLLCYRSELVAELQKDAATRAFLERHDLPANSPKALIAEAVARLRGYYASRCAQCPRRGLRTCKNASFPHEIAIVLGYPDDDVEGFIAQQGKCAKACGRWKVYGSERAAKRRFAQIRAAEQRCRQLSRAGASVRELIASTGR